MSSIPRGYSLREALIDEKSTKILKSIYSGKQMLNYCWELSIQGNLYDYRIATRLLYIIITFQNTYRGMSKKMDRKTQTNGNSVNRQ